MIFFKPVEETDGTFSFEAFEDDISFGKCKMQIKDNIADIFELSYFKDKPYLVEALIKSALNYAGNKNIYMCSCSCENITSFLKNMNFESKDNKFISDIPSVLQGSCKNCYKT